MKILMKISERFSTLYGIQKNPYVAEGFDSEDGLHMVRARVLGGGTTTNGGFYTRASSSNIHKMKWDEKILNESYEWVEKLVTFKEDNIFNWSSSFMNRLLKLGVLPYNGYTLDHFEGTKIGASIFDKNGKRYIALDLLQHANIDNILVLLNATTSIILFNSASVKVMVNLSVTPSMQDFSIIDNGHSKTLPFFGPTLQKNQSNDDALAMFCKDTLSTFYHYHGVFQVGLVVDKRYQVKGVDNLRVVDNSFFKDSASANPQATTMMLGKYLFLSIIKLYYLAFKALNL